MVKSECTCTYLNPLITTNYYFYTNRICKTMRGNSSYLLCQRCELCACLFSEKGFVFPLVTNYFLKNSSLFRSGSLSRESAGCPRAISLIKLRVSSPLKTFKAEVVTVFIQFIDVALITHIMHVCNMCQKNIYNKVPLT